MFNIRKYRIGFDWKGLILFMIIMLPNIIWFAVPASNDPLRNESITPKLDMVAQIFQVMMVIALCVVINKDRLDPMHIKHRISIGVCITLYFLGWILYYLGIVNPVIHLDLCIAPCMAFIMFTIARKNVVALFFTCVFMTCHIAYGIINFVI